jgi:hypothetical protein
MGDGHRSFAAANPISMEPFSELIFNPTCSLFYKIAEKSGKSAVFSG